MTVNKARNLKNLGRIYLSYLRREEAPAQLPSRVWIEPTPSCNLRCGHCPNGMDVKFPTGLMKMELFRKVIDELEGAVYDVNLFHRGESLIHPKLAEMVEYCADKGLHTRLHTNAGLLTEEKSRELIGAGLSYISFSVDGYTKEVYEKTRVGGDFGETMENITRFLKIKKDLGRGPYSIVQVMEIGEEKEGLARRRAAFREMFNGLPLDRLIVRTPHNWAGDFKKFGRGVVDDSDAPFTPCTFLWYSMTIFFDGTVAPCPQDFFGKINMGDVSRSTVAEVWNGEAMRRLRRRMRERDVAGLEPCEECDMLCRRTFMGVPSNYLSTFIRDNVLVK
ncbi:MAG: radical SAM/SPASM domain-containing protein [Candidatus Nitrospinota bacterium M3_3B_026]